MKMLRYRVVLKALDNDADVRDMTVDITEEGLSIIKGEAWSTMDVGNLRVGDKADGKSFGRFVVQQYETGSSMTIIPGGASRNGPVCAGDGWYLCFLHRRGV